MVLFDLGCVGPTITVTELLLGLYHWSGGSARVMYFQFLRWCGDIIDHHDLWQGAISDPLCAPLPVGTFRHLPIDPRLKMAVASEAASGRLGRSGQQVCKALARFKKTGYTKGDWNVNVGNRWMTEGAAREFDARMSAMKFLCDFRVVHMAMDATRFGGLDCLYTAIQDGDMKFCCWAPPLATLFRTKLFCGNHGILAREKSAEKARSTFRKSFYFGNNSLLQFCKVAEHVFRTKSSVPKRRIGHRDPTF